MKNLKLVLITLAALSLLGAGIANATAPPAKLPKTGAWQTKDGTTGFTLKRGKGEQSKRLFLSNVHVVTEAYGNCLVEGPVTVLGKFALKKFTINGANLVGVGKAEGFELLRLPVKVVFEGQTVDGKFSASFSPNGSRATIFVETQTEASGYCTANVSSVGHK